MLRSSGSRRCRPSPTVAPATLKPKTIVFSDHRDDKLADAGNGPDPVRGLGRERPVQKQFLSLFPGLHGADHQGLGSRHPQILYRKAPHVRGGGALPDRARRQAPIDLARYHPHRRAGKDRPGDQAPAHHGGSGGAPGRIPQSAHNRHPGPALVRGAGEPVHRVPLSARGQAAGRHPPRQQAGGGGKKISEFMEFQTEIRVLPPEEIDQAGLAKLTGVETPVAGVLEQTIFNVNQVMQFGKLLAVLQEHPCRSEPGRSRRCSWRSPSRPMCWSARRSSRTFPCCGT